MDLAYAIAQLERNKDVIYALMNGCTDAEYDWKATPMRWNLLEIICHLYDEEREDFRTRFINVVETPDNRPPSFDPVAWVTERAYASQNFEEKLAEFLLERDKSIDLLKNLENPNLSQGYDYAAYGHVDGLFFLTNWLAHDYLHIKQIVRIKYDYAAQLAERDISYAGTWT